MINDKDSVFVKRKMSIKEYRKMKIKMLKNDFLIKLSDEEIAYVETLTTEVKLDQWALSIINSRWS